MRFSPPHLLDGARWENRRVGLLGGSFNPPHEGHVHISRIALRTLQLDALWWLVSPQNPLKENPELPFEKRFALCRDLTDSCSGIIVSDIEKQFGTNLTWQTITLLKNHFPKTDLIWITGMDNALSMHTWHHWRRILEMVPTAHISRPPALTLIRNCPLKMLAKQKHRHIEKSEKVDLNPGHTYWLMQKKMMALSSTEIRKNNK